MASKMYLILKGSKLGGDKDLIATLENNKNIEIITQASVKAISGNSVLQQITVVDSSGSEKVLDVDGDGQVTALGDGLMVIRKLFGTAFAGDALTSKAMSNDATRTTDEIHEYIAAMSDVGSGV